MHMAIWGDGLLMGFLLARFEVPSFLEVNVKIIEIADMMFNYIIFRFKLQHIH